MSLICSITSRRQATRFARTATHLLMREITLYAIRKGTVGTVVQLGRILKRDAGVFAKEHVPPRWTSLVTKMLRRSLDSRLRRLTKLVTSSTYGKTTYGCLYACHGRACGASSVFFATGNEALYGHVCAAHLACLAEDEQHRYACSH